ncbi:pyridoxamine 5'-phosphate oxidase family protein [Buchnera aphidicola]|uniref:pyridoxamine 5'-phosphate oxidase family protein n=1 Tax=Buchnera aphidicola TaxID=9 RepID=UPI003D189CB8
MILSTTDKFNKVNQIIILLKNIFKIALYFCINLHSRKFKNIKLNAYVSILFR